MNRIKHRGRRGFVSIGEDLPKTDDVAAVYHKRLGRVWVYGGRLDLGKAKDTPEVLHVDSLAEFADTLAKDIGQIGVVLPQSEADLEKLVAQLRSHQKPLLDSTARIIVFASARYAEVKGLSGMMQNRLVDFYPDSISKDDFKTLMGVLVSSAKADVKTCSAAQQTPTAQASSGRADLAKLGLLDFHRYTDSLHNRESGRLDIRPVAALFGITVSELARFIGIEEKTALKTPDSKNVHERLLPYEQIAGALDLLDGDASAFRKWLNSANSELHNQTPMQLVKEGKAKDLAGLVRSALLGQPN